MLRQRMVRWRRRSRRSRSGRRRTVTIVTLSLQA